jgi:hypothetical protein
MGRLLPFAALLLSACTPGIQLNRGYRPHVDSPPTIAIVPMLNETSGVSDAIFESVFDTPAKRCAVVPMAPVRERLLQDERLRGLLQSVAERAWAKEDLQRAPRIQDVIGNDGFANVRQAMGSADLLLFPVSFRTAVFAGHTQGWITYRLYDLRDGRIVFHDEKDLNADAADENARRVLLLYFATLARQDVEEHFLNASR